MTMDIQSAIEILKTINPGNIHIRTNATDSQRDDFQGLWSRHTPSAARIFLLPNVLDGSIVIT